MNKPIITQDFNAASSFVKHNVCARCYGNLTIYAQPNSKDNVIQCDQCADAWGYTTIKRSTAEKRQQQALVEFREVKVNLPDLFPNPHKGKSAAQLIEELGL